MSDTVKKLRELGTVLKNDFKGLLDGLPGLAPVIDNPLNDIYADISRIYGILHTSWLEQPDERSIYAEDTADVPVSEYGRFSPESSDTPARIDHTDNKSSITNDAQPVAADSGTTRTSVDVPVQSEPSGNGMGSNEESIPRYKDNTVENTAGHYPAGNETAGAGMRSDGPKSTGANKELGGLSKTGGSLKDFAGLINAGKMPVDNAREYPVSDEPVGSIDTGGKDRIVSQRGTPVSNTGVDDTTVGTSTTGRSNGTSDIDGPGRSGGSLKDFAGLINAGTIRTDTASDVPEFNERKDIIPGADTVPVSLRKPESTGNGRQIPGKRSMGYTPDTGVTNTDPPVYEEKKNTRVPESGYEYTPYRTIHPDGEVPGGTPGTGSLRDLAAHVKGDYRRLFGREENDGDHRSATVSTPGQQGDTMIRTPGRYHDNAPVAGQQRNAFVDRSVPFTKGGTGNTELSGDGGERKTVFTPGMEPTTLTDAGQYLEHAAHREEDYDAILDALKKEIESEYKRFYGDS